MKMKKTLMVVLGVVLAIGAIVGTCIGLRKDDDTVLKLNVASNIEVYIGEEKEIEASSNLNDDVVYRFRVDDDSVAKFLKVDSKNYIKGLTIGETTLHVVAGHNDSYVTKDIAIKVCDANQKPNTGDDESKDEKPNFKLLVEYNELSGNVIRTNAEDVMLEFVFDNANETEIKFFSTLKIEKYLYNNTYSVTIPSDGTFEFSVVIDGKNYTYTIIKG